MVKDKELLERFNRDQHNKKAYSYPGSLKIFEALWQEACDLGVLPLKNYLEEIESCLRIARALNYKERKDV